MQQYSAFFQTLHDETGPTGHLGRGTHYSILRAMVFHDPMGKPLPEGTFADFAVIWDEDHDLRVMEPIQEIYRQGFLSSFTMFGERKGSFTAILANRVSSAAQALPCDPVFLRDVDELEISVRAANCLTVAGIVYIGDLVQQTEMEMLRGPNFGRKSLIEIKMTLERLGLHFGMDVPGWRPPNFEELVRDGLRSEVLKSRIATICQSLDDPWTSDVVPLQSANNPIISDDSEKVSIYLRNLEMLWRLGIALRQEQKGATKVPETADRAA